MNNQIHKQKYFFEKQNQRTINIFQNLLKNNNNKPNI